VWWHGVVLELLNLGERSSEGKIFFGVEELLFCTRPGEVTDCFFLFFFFGLVSAQPCCDSGERRRGVASRDLNSGIPSAQEWRN